MTFKSVYERDDYHTVIVQKEIKYRKFGYILRDELVSDGINGDTLLKVCYDFNGLYLGNNKTANMLCRKYKLCDFEPSDSGNIASIGYSADKKKWYGWSHRAIYGFGIGSTVKRGDCGYAPINKGDVLIDLLNFWDVGKVQDIEKGKTCVKDIVSIDLDYKHQEKYYLCTGSDEEAELSAKEANEELSSHVDYELGEEQLGIQIITETLFNYERESGANTHFKPYPAKWGRGEWTANTIKDAKEMARAFANGVA